jgi:hypothetical protein
LLALSDEEIATMGAAVAKGEPTNLPPEELLYTRAAVQDLHVFPELQVARVLDVLAQVRMYNETAAEWKENLRLTFEPGLSTANHSIARAKVRSNEEQAVKRGRNIIQRIAGLEQAFEDVTLRRRLTFPGARARISNVLRSLRARH